MGQYHGQSQPAPQRPWYPDCASADDPNGLHVLDILVEVRMRHGSCRFYQPPAKHPVSTAIRARAPRSSAVPTMFL